MIAAFDAVHTEQKDGIAFYFITVVALVAVVG